MSKRGSPLRQRARARLGARGGGGGPERPEPQDLREALAEVQVHQVELELQNEELQNAQRGLEESRAALAASELHYRELFDRAPIGYLHLERDGLILEANLRAAALLGVERSVLRGRKLDEYVLPEQQDAWYLHRKAAARGEQPAPVRLTLRAPNGDMREVELEGRAVETQSDELYVALLDVTARERAEAARSESERQQRLMANALPVGVGYVGSDGRFELCNPRFAALLGYPASAIEGRPIFEVLGAEAYAALREHLRAALAGETTRFEGELALAKPGPRFVSVRLAPDPDPGGQVRGFYLLMDDRTELERTRRELRTASGQVALAEERERRALAADLHDEVAQLLSLASIKLREVEEQVGEGGRGALRQVAELLHQVRDGITSLSFELSPPLLYDVGLGAALEWLADSLKRRFGLRTQVSARGELAPLDEATRVTLFRAARELLINVAKHAGTKRARVVLQTGPEGVSLVVEDQGHGFDPEHQPRGFGLNNVLDRVESLGGRVELMSVPGDGTRVTLRLPVAASGGR